jgi:hypothetical protein
MNLDKYMVSVVLAICVTLAGSRASAHGDPDTALYVAPNGVDRGNCQNATAPCRSMPFALNRVGNGGQIRVPLPAGSIVGTQSKG